MTELMLKLAAFLAMVIDHAAACRLDRVRRPPYRRRSWLWRNPSTRQKV